MTFVLLRNLHAESAELAQAVDDMLGILAGFVDDFRIDLGAEKILQGVVELGEFRTFALFKGKRVHQRQGKIAEEHLADAGASDPFLLARILGDLSRLLLGRDACVSSAHGVFSP
jgi:hypothetical protein